ncbi:alpha/beta hydrolase [Geothrix mesophila]|uniref:alpha/beta hydrolase n=1 Tax=Geothrix mesophila TaxID=2922723 RepID=UPI001FAE2148|nr:alpha/beta hydrolase [Geothrix sp. SG198]
MPAPQPRLTPSRILWPAALAGLLAACATRPPVVQPAPAPAPTPAPVPTPAPPPPPPPPAPSARPPRPEPLVDAEASRPPEDRRMAERVEMPRRAASSRPSLPPPRPTPVGANPNVDRDQAYARVSVMFGTDRKLDPRTGSFGGGRGAGIAYGEVIVSVPHGHKTGEIEAPSLWKLEFREDPRKHMAILDWTPHSRMGFLNRVKARVQAKGASGSSFVFVHGYNVAFDDAARRTAQITYDLDYRGVPVFYSWPSQGTLQGYTTDENNAQWSEANLKKFLVDFAQKSGVTDIYLIAHSMGNRVLTGALRQAFAEQPKLKGRFKEIILTAPDIDAEIFKRDIAPALVAGCDRITLYASNGDNALLASKKVHGYPRAGDTAEGIVVVPGIETIDASGLDTSLLEHSYFATAPPVISDIRRVLLDGLRAARRGLEPHTAGGGGYWKLKAAKP